jgi:hypothetical protein
MPQSGAKVAGVEVVNDTDLAGAADGTWPQQETRVGGQWGTSGAHPGGEARSALATLPGRGAKRAGDL